MTNSKISRERPTNKSFITAVHRHSSDRVKLCVSACAALCRGTGLSSLLIWQDYQKSKDIDCCTGQLRRRSTIRRTFVGVIMNSWQQLSDDHNDCLSSRLQINDFIFRRCRSVCVCTGDGRLPLLTPPPPPPLFPRINFILIFVSKWAVRSFSSSVAPPEIENGWAGVRGADCSASKYVVNDKLAGRSPACLWRAFALYLLCRFPKWKPFLPEIDWKNLSSVYPTSLCVNRSWRFYAWKFSQTTIFRSKYEIRFVKTDRP